MLTDGLIVGFAAFMGFVDDENTELCQPDSSDFVPSLLTPLVLIKSCQAANSPFINGLLRAQYTC